MKKVTDIYVKKGNIKKMILNKCIMGGVIWIQLVKHNPTMADSYEYGDEP